MLSASQARQHAKVRLRIATRAAMLCMAVAASGCDGPGERAGRDADKASAAAKGEMVQGEGPNELLGEAQDRIERAERKARDARADALEKQADALRTQTDVQARQLEDKASAIRAADQ